MAYTTIKKPSDYFNTKIYTGTGSTLNITGLDFQPDFNWTKNRLTAGGYSHNLCDVVRGTTKYSKSNSTSAEQTASDRITSFNSDGYTLGTDANSEHNVSGHTYVSWNWLANGAGVANTDGSISSTVSANTTSGFSIVSYTGNLTAGATIGHGLGTTLSMIILKDRDGTPGWRVGHSSLGFTKYMPLDGTNAAITQTNIWNDTTPTSSVFSVGDGSSVNANGNNYIAYCFAEKKGFSKFGSYTGNGSTDGTFVYTGMRPAFLMLKRTDTTGSWHMYDNKRDTYNPETKRLGANLSSEESSAGSIDIDFLSNGFKMRNSTADWNASGGTYIYMAFAEEPLVGDNPATAR